MYGVYENGKLIAKFIAPLTVKSNQPIFVSDALSLKRHVSQRAAQRWEITAGLEPLSHNAQDLFVTLVTKGFSEVHKLIMPQNYGAVQRLSSTSVAPKVVGGALKYATQLLIKDIVGTIPKGTFIKFSDHSKIYMLTADVISEGSMNIYPPLRRDVAGDTNITFKNDVIMDALYDTDNVAGMVYTDGILMDMGAVTFIEYL